MVKVQVEQGWLEGEQLDLVTGDGQYYSFKGVPYAAPPLGKLRFKEPQPPLPWEGVRKATEHGPVCTQFNILANKVIPGSEDCLFLNVYTRELQPKSPLPVMVFIHGGGFQSGSGDVDFYGPDFLVNKDVILVTVNYRLEVLGFLNLDIPEVPGNAGMKDQVAALKWVNKNIKNFGGDPKNVTVFGESCGGTSVVLHMLSPLSKGLIKRGIPMSGTPICDWANSFEARRRAFKLGQQLGLETKDPYRLLEFLQDLPADKLINTNPQILALEENINNVLRFFHFTPVVEKDFGGNHFLTKDPIDYIKKGKLNADEVLIGYTDQELLFGVENIKTALDGNYKEYPEAFVPKGIIYNSTPSKVLELSDIIREHFFGEKDISSDLLKEAVQYFSESTFLFPVAHFIDLLLNKTKLKIYRYKFSCVSERNLFGRSGAKYGLVGASHVDDLQYIFDPKSVNLKISKGSKEYKMVQQTSALFTNFAKYGNPTPDEALGVTWNQYDSLDGSYLNIGETLVPGLGADKDAVAFWRSLYKIAGLEDLIGSI